MEKRRKVGFFAKLLSNHYYLSEVPVEGKTTGKFFKNVGYKEHYVGQVIRTGNCITLLSTVTPLTVELFWNTHYFEDFARFVFWTFNKSFVLKLTDKLESLKPSVVQRCAELLKEHFTPYGEPMPETADEELQWCYIKNGNLKIDPRYRHMYLLDEQNRTVILEAIERRMAAFIKPLTPNGTLKDLPLAEEDTRTANNTVLLLEVVRPMDGSAGATLQFIRQKVAEAGFEYNIFSPVSRLENGKNPYGLNGCMAAMIDHFYQLNYFKQEFTLEEIFKAYLQYSGNSIGKLKTFISEFRQDKSFIKHLEKLKQLKISKLP